MKTATLRTELRFSVGYVQAKQRLQDLNYKSVCVPDLTGGFVHPRERAYLQN